VAGFLTSKNTAGEFILEAQSESALDRIAGIVIYSKIMIIQPLRVSEELMN
jgi:hypothetical protein